MKKIVLILGSTIASITPLLLPLSSCSCKTSNQHVNCDEKNKITYGKASYTLNFDEDFDQNNIDLSLEGGDADKLKIYDVSKNEKNLTIKIGLKDSISIKTNCVFNLIVKNKDKWEQKIENIMLTCDVVDEEIKQHDENSWQHAIEHISSCKHPTIFIATDASYFVQLAVNLFLSASQLAIKNGHIFTNDEYKFNDLIYIVPKMAWDYKNNKTREGVTNFDYLYNSLIDSKFGYSDIIKNSKDAGRGEIDPSLGNQMIITNMQDFDLSMNDYDESLPSFEKFDGFNWSVNFINKILDIYEHINPELKFNFVTNDYCWNNICNCHSTNDDFAKLQIRMFKKMDKLYLLSDGAYSWITGVQVFKDFVQKQGYYNANNQNEIWEKLTTLPDKEALDYYKAIDPRIFFNNEKYCYHFECSTKVTNAPVNIDNDILTSDFRFKEGYPWLIPSSYSKILTGSTDFENYLQSYLTFFQFYKEGRQQKFSDYIAYGTYSNFNPDKKNLIFLIPGALVDQSSTEENIYVECRKILTKIRENYPQSKWNFLFSFHPRSKEENIKKCLCKLFETESPELWPNNTIVIDNHNPFEYLLVVDQYLAQKDPNHVYHMIDPTTLDEDKPSGVVTGFDISSTCYFAAISIMANEYNIDIDKAKKIIQLDSYYIPTKFKAPGGYIVDGNDYLKDNKSFLKSMYEGLYQVNEFINPESFQIFNWLLFFFKS